MNDRASGNAVDLLDCCDNSEQRLRLLTKARPHLCPLTLGERFVADVHGRVDIPVDTDGMAMRAIEHTDVQRFLTGVHAAMRTRLTCVVRFNEDELFFVPRALVSQ